MRFISNLFSDPTIRSYMLGALALLAVVFLIRSLGALLKIFVVLAIIVGIGYLYYRFFV